MYYLTHEDFENPWRSPWTAKERPLVLVDGVHHPFAGISAPIRGRLAYVSNINDRQWVRLCEALDVEELRVYAMRVGDWAPLRQLRKLKRLAVEWNTKVETLAPLSTLNLQSLVLRQIPKVRDLSPLAPIVHLEKLVLSSDMWSPDKVKTLAPLAHLSKLRELGLSGIRVMNGGLKPVASCASLRLLHLDNGFLTEEYAWLSARRPDIQCDMFTPYYRIDDPFTGNDRQVVGKDKPSLHSVRNAHRVMRYVRAFEELQTRIRTEEGILTFRLG